LAVYQWMGVRRQISHVRLIYLSESSTLPALLCRRGSPHKVVQDNALNT